ncbi:MAG: molybdate ABC transporter substrate-binding protein [Thermaurantiacus sp.]
MRRRDCLAGFLAFAAAPAVALAQRERPPPIAAAADLQAAMPEVLAAFRRQTGLDVRVTYGSSGNFAQQILRGAPFQMFLSADESFVERVVDGGRALDGGRLYAIGRIGLFQPRGSPVAADPGLRDLAAAVGDGRLQRFSIANPEHAPYGRAAREALLKAGIWASIQPRLVFGENAAQATQFAMSGSAQGGIIPLALALTDHVRNAGSFALLDVSWHAPLRQRMVLLRGAGATARAFFAYMESPPARTVLRRYGFLLPGERME